jgi:tetratricopeptide (TPR) repeat protein
MNRAKKRSIAGWLVGILVFQFLAAFRLYADVIYMNDGNVLMVEKAWEEGEEVKYQTSKGIQSLPRSSVRSIRQEKPAPAPSVQKWGNVADQPNQTGTNSSALAPSVPSISGSGTVVSKDILARLRDNLYADPSDAVAKAELVQALNSIASLQAAEGDLASAQNSLEEALNLDKRNTALLSNLAAIHFRSGNYQKAEDLLVTCLQIDGKNQWTHYLLGETYYKEEKISQAISEWDEGLKLGPNETIVKRLEKAKREAGVHSKLGIVQSLHFILRYENKASDNELGYQILAALEDSYRHLSNELTSHAPETVVVILYPDQAYSDITRAPGWSGGIYDGKIRLPIKGLLGITPELKATLTHELTHCFMAALSGHGSPTWFLEGVAQLQEGRSAANDRKVLTHLKQENQLIPLENLRGSFAGLPPGMADLAYTESLSAVEYLITRFGRPAVRSLLDLMAQNYNFENAFNKAVLRSVSEFETAWQRDLTQ